MSQDRQEDKKGWLDKAEEIAKETTKLEIANTEKETFKPELIKETVKEVFTGVDDVSEKILEMEAHEKLLKQEIENKKRQAEINKIREEIATTMSGNKKQFAYTEILMNGNEPKLKIDYNSQNQLEKQKNKSKILNFFRAKSQKTEKLNEREQTNLVA